MGLKTGSEWFRFPAWVQFFVSGVTCSARLLRLFSCGDLRWLRDVIGKALLTIVDFVAPLRLWHGLRPPPMVGFVERVQRAGFQVSLARVWARRVQERPRVARGKRRESAPLARCLFNCPVWTPPTGGWSNQIVRMGRSSTHVHGFLARHFQWRKE